MIISQCLDLKNKDERTETMVKCPKCGSDIEIKDRKCPVCNANLEEEYLHDLADLIENCDKARSLNEYFSEKSEWFRQSYLDGLTQLAEQGNDLCQDVLAELYYKGEAVEQDYLKALKWFHAAARQGNDSAEYNLGVMYENGEGTAPNSQEAIKWFRLSTGHRNSDSPDKEKYLFLEEKLRPILKNSVKFYHEVAQYGYKYGAAACGLMVAAAIEKEDIEDRDEKSAEWLLYSAERGQEMAQLLLAERYLKGKGVKRNYEEAACWYRASAEQGNTEAQYNMGIMYETGCGVPASYRDAKKWYRMAADQGHKKAAAAYKKLEKQRKTWRDSLPE